MQGKLTLLKARQKHFYSPPKLITRYRVVVYALRHHYPPSSHDRPAIRSDNFRNMLKAPEFSICDSWTNVEKLQVLFIGLTLLLICHDLYSTAIYIVVIFKDVFFAK
jgi:hypothetical protein